MNTSADLVGSLIPNIYLSRITLQSTPDDKLMANIQIFLREFVDNSEISTWLEDSEVLKNLKIFVIQSSDPEITDKLVKIYNGELSYAGQAVSAFSSEENFELFKTFFSNTYGLDTNKLYYKKINIFELQNSSLNDLEASGRAEKIENSDGTRTYNIFFDINFDNLIEEDPLHLTYLFGSFYDVEPLVKSLFPDIEQEQLQEMGVFSDSLISNLNIENVISEGDLKSTTFIYVDEVGEVWSGLTHTQNVNGQLIVRSGPTETADSKTLLRVEIENNKIQDFRQVRRQIQAIRFDIEDSEILGSFEEADIQTELVKEKDTSAISSGFVSIDNTNKVAVSFFIDRKKMFINNSIYGQILNSRNAYGSINLIDQLYKFGSIESLVLRSKRVDIDRSLLRSEEYERIVYEAYGTQKVFELNKQINFLQLEQSLAQQLRMYSMVDSQAQKDGVYEYFLDIEYKDNVFEQINELILNLRFEQNKFKDYYEIAITPAAFNTTTNRFRKNAFNLITDLDELTDFSISGNVYLNVVTSFFKVDPYSIINFATNFLSPTQGTPETIWSVISLYDYLITSLENSISLTSFVNNSLNEKGSGTLSEESAADPYNLLTDSKTKNNSRIIKITKKLNARADLRNSYFLEYLDHTKQETSQLSVSTGFLFDLLKTDLISKKLNTNTVITKQIEQDKRNEIVFKKLFDIVSTYSDMSVVRGRPSFQEDKTDTSFVQDSQNSIFPINSSLLDEIEQKLLTTFDDSEQQSLNRLMFALLNPTVHSSNQKLDIIYGSNSRNSSRLLVNEHDNLYLKTNPREADVLDGFVSQLFPSSRFAFEDAREFPNQLKSLIILKNNTSQPFMSDSEARFRYEMIKQVSYLQGFQFRQETKTFDLEIPIWAPLKTTSLNSLNENINLFLFCKMEDYSNRTIRYKFNQALREQTTNEYFLINNKNISNRGLIADGPTQISLPIFEERCVNETKWFFNGESEPQVTYQIEGTQIVPNDSHTNTKYSFLTPYGVHMDSEFRVVNKFGTLLQTSILIGIVQPPEQSGVLLENLNVNMTFSFDTTRTRSLNLFGAQNLSQTVLRSLANYKPSDLAIYTRSDFLKR